VCFPSFCISYTHCLKALKDMGTEFLTGYINLAENEKDPRNLLIAFAIDRVILIEFDISHHVEVGAIFLVKFKTGTTTSIIGFV
jgi:Dos2-interacting transcription regulator of RNA-Pol-II